MFPPFFTFFLSLIFKAYLFITRRTAVRCAAFAFYMSAITDAEGMSQWNDRFKKLNMVRPKSTAVEKIDIKPQFGNIKDELFLISFMILSAGLVFTDAYYQRFGFRYQALNLSTFHIVYKGLTTIFTSPLMLLPYALTIALVMFEFYAIKNKMDFFLSLRTPIIYLFLIVNLLIIFQLGKSTGLKQAFLDMHENTTGLPRIKLLKTSNLTIQAPMDNYLLFLVDDNFVTYFEPMKKEEKFSYPIIKRVAKHDVSILDTYF